MSSTRCLIIPLLLIAVFATISFSDSPPPNTIPVITMKTGQDASCEDISVELICELSWNHFDGVWLEGWTNWSTMRTIFEWCDSTGMYVVSAPALLQVLGGWPPDRWARYDQNTLQSDSAFFQPDSTFEEIDSVRYATTMLDDIVERCSTLAYDIEDFDCIWYYDIFNEAPSWQLRRMLNKQVTLPYDDYFPNVLTQDTSMSTVATDGVFSWLKWKSDSLDSDHSISITFGGFHAIENWAEHRDTLGTFHTQASSVRAFMSTMYQAYSDSPPYPASQNYPEFLGYNAYPIRLVGTYYQDTSDVVSTLGDSLDTWMLDHYETIMDSTFIPAWKNDCFPVHYHPQAFGRTGGLSIWDSEDADSIVYGSYPYRIPSPAEFLMLCNLGLMMQAKGVFPYCIRSYSEIRDDTVWHHDTGLLDEDLIAFDAPYEEWVYRERPSDDFYYAPPDSIPPWTDVDGDDFDPLFDLPDRPINVPGSERNRENYLLWKFKAYGMLWNSMRETIGEIATVAPELSTLWWWEDLEYDADIVSGDSANLPLLYVTPEVRVFTDSTESAAFLFYLNRHCRTGKLPFLVSVDEGDFPSGAITELLLDHSRRFIIPVSDSSGIHSWRDTLEAGQGRLVEFVDSTMAADIRITDPDICALHPGTVKKTFDFEFTAGEDIDILATFFNMSADSVDDVVVICSDLTDDAEIDRDTLDFTGLSLSGGVCDSETGRFAWETDSTDIGVHILEMSASPVAGEPDTLDNSAIAVFLIQPRDYATIVVDDPWDMTEDKASPPLWHTSDIDSLFGWNMDSTLTDSISGMFEGVITDPSDTNRVYLNVHDIKPIEPDRFSMLSLAGIALERTLSVYLGWSDEVDSVYVVDTGLDLTTDWLESDPVSIGSLSSDWDTLDVKQIWLEFRGTNIDTSVRLGWVKLTE